MNRFRALSGDKLFDLNKENFHLILSDSALVSIRNKNNMGFLSTISAAAAA